MCAFISMSNQVHLIGYSLESHSVRAIRARILHCIARTKKNVQKELDFGNEVVARNRSGRGYEAMSSQDHDSDFGKWLWRDEIKT